MGEPVTNDRQRSFDGQTSRRVSFVLHTLDRSTFIGKALDMAKELVGPEDELIVVDGGSTDGTPEIIARYDDLVDVFISEADDHSTHAQNKGILLARGKYIKPLNDDDEFFPEAMNQAIGVLEAHPEVDVLLCGGTRQIDGKDYPFYVSPGVNYGKCTEDVFRYGNCGCGTIIRRSALAKIGLFNYGGVATDAEFIAQAICNNASVKFCRINLFRHPIHADSYFTRRRKDYQQDRHRMVKQYCCRSFYLKCWIKDAIRRTPVLGRMAVATRDGLVAFLAAIGNKRARSVRAPVQPTWDGKFS